MATGGSGAVFFLGSRAHYQVLQQPESSYDLKNGNASTETIYQNPSVQDLWSKEQTNKEGTDNYVTDRGNWGYDNDVTVMDEKEKSDIGNNAVNRSKRRASEATLCERDADMKPALLNTLGDSVTPKPKSRRRIPLVTFLSSLGRRKRRLRAERAQYLQHIESALMRCTYRESCRCLECQSRYFECDDDSEDYSSDECDYQPRYVSQVSEDDEEKSRGDDDEVFVDTVPDDNTSTDVLLDKEKMSICSEEPEADDPSLHLEVAAGTPVFLNYLLTHPITCAIQ